METDKEYKAKRSSQFLQALADADSNKDGYLDYQEFKVLLAKLKEMSIESGNFVDDR